MIWSNFTRLTFYLNWIHGDKNVFSIVIKTNVWQSTVACWQKQWIDKRINVQTILLMIFNYILHTNVGIQNMFKFDCRNELVSKICLSRPVVYYDTKSYRNHVLNSFNQFQISLLAMKAVLLLIFVLFQLTTVIVKLIIIWNRISI